MLIAAILAASMPLHIEIKQDLETKLYDAGSAKFIFPKRRDDRVYCGFVNAKNRMGAYTGYRLFYVMTDGDVDVKFNNPSLGIGELICSSAGYPVFAGEVS